jgi:hypothetical protein
MKKIRITWMACLLLFLSVPVTVSPAVAAVCTDITCGLVIHWDFDGNVNNNGLDLGIKDLNSTLPSPSYAPDVNGEAGKALSYTSTDSASLTKVMAALKTLDYSTLSVSFNLQMNGNWGHYVIIATGNKLQLFMNNFPMPEVTLDNPVDFLKSINIASIASLADNSSTFSGAIDDFRVYNRELSRSNISQLSKPVISKQMGLNASSKISMDDIVKNMKVINTTTRDYLQALLEMISPISPIIVP